MDGYYKLVAEARLKKFYSIFNQAIVLSEAKNGPKESWYQDVGGVDFDDEGNAITETNEIDKWFSKYLEDFITIKKKSHNSGAMVYYLNDGSQFIIGSNNGDGKFFSTRDIIFYPFGNSESCLAKGNAGGYGSCAFLFQFHPISNSEGWKYLYQKGLEPFITSWDGNYNSLYTNGAYGCNGNNAAYCTAIIQRNGWKVPKNYPKKIRP